MGACCCHGPGDKLGVTGGRPTITQSSAVLKTNTQMIAACNCQRGDVKNAVFNAMGSPDRLRKHLSYAVGHVYITARGAGHDQQPITKAPAKFEQQVIRELPGYSLEFRSVTKSTLNQLGVSAV